jgi:hypothetical protein
MKRDEFGLKPPHHSYVDMIEHLSDGVHVDVINRRDDEDERRNVPRASATVYESSRPFYRSSRDAQD